MMLWLPIKIRYWPVRQYSEYAASWMIREFGFESQQVEIFFASLQQSVHLRWQEGVLEVLCNGLIPSNSFLVSCDVSFVFVYLCAVELWPNHLRILKRWNRKKWRFCFVTNHTTNWCWCSLGNLMAVTWRLWRRRCDRIKSQMTLQILVSSG